MRHSERTGPPHGRWLEQKIPAARPRRSPWMTEDFRVVLRFAGFAREPPSTHRCGPTATNLGGSSVKVTSAIYCVSSSRKLISRFGGLLVLTSERMQEMFLASNFAYSSSPAVGRQSWF